MFAARIILVLFSGLLLMAQQELPERTFRTTVSEVVVPVTVTTASGSYVNGLEARDFRLYDNEKLQDIRLNLTYSPVSIVVAIQRNAEVENMLPKIKKIDERMSKRWGEGTFVIPAPIEVDEIMRKVPKGKLITINEIRQILAKKHGATIACPMTTGIFAWIAAHAAEEAAAEGKKNTTPYWRTLKTGGVINEKYPGGIENQKELLEKEGHKIIQKGKKSVVADLEESLIEL